MCRGAQVFHSSRGHLKILGAETVTWSKFQTKDLYVLGAPVQNLVATAIWRQGILCPSLRVSIVEVHPITGHEGPEREQMYSSTLPSTTALDGGGWSTPRPGRFTPRERPGTHCVGGWWTPGPVWTGAENPTSTGIRSPDRPVRSESLYWLRYPGTHGSNNQSSLFA